MSGTTDVGPLPSDDTEIYRVRVSLRAYDRLKKWVLEQFVPKSIQWVDFRENLQEAIDFPMDYGVFL